MRLSSILVLCFLSISCSTSLERRHLLNHKPAAFGPMMDMDSLNYDMYSRRLR